MLHGMATYLDDRHFIAPQTDSAYEFRDHIASIAAKLASTHRGTDGDQTQTVDPPDDKFEKPDGETFVLYCMNIALSWNSEDPVLPVNGKAQICATPKKSRGMLCRNILPPSPEKRQKRHDSRGIH